jgi:hypothetical protein
MTRSLWQLGLSLTAVFLLAPPVLAQSALGGAVGGPAAEAWEKFRDSPGLGVDDRAGLFSADAVARAREAVRQFRKDYHRDLFIETFAHVPDGDRKDVSGLWTWSRERYFTGWAKRRAKTVGVDGVYVLICKQPKHVHVLVYPDTPEQAFTDDNTKELRRRLERQLPKAPDAALEDAAAFVRDTVKENLAAREAAAASIRFGTVAWLLGAVLGIWLLLSLVRAVLHWRGAAAADPAHVGLTAGFFAGLFGTTAGHWVYDRLFRAHAPASPQPESDFLRTPVARPADLEHAADLGDQEAFDR